MLFSTSCLEINNSSPSHYAVIIEDPEPWIIRERRNMQHMVESGNLASESLAESLRVSYRKLLTVHASRLLVGLYGLNLERCGLSSICTPCCVTNRLRHLHYPHFITDTLNAEQIDSQI